MHRASWRRLALVAVGAVLFAGCASTPARLSAEAARAVYGPLGVVAVDATPTTTLTPPATSRGKGAREGARTGFVTPIVIGAAALSGGRDLRGLFVGALLGLAISPVTTLAGAIYGAATAQSPNDVAHLAQLLEAHAAGGDSATSLREVLLHRLREADLDVRADGDDREIASTLEVDVTELALRAGSVLRMSSRFRVLKGGIATPWTEIAVESDGYPVSRWASDDGTLFRKELARQIEVSAARIVEAMLSKEAR